MLPGQCLRIHLPDLCGRNIVKRCLQEMDIRVQRLPQDICLPLQFVALPGRCRTAARMEAQAQIFSGWYQVPKVSRESAPIMKYRWVSGMAAFSAWMVSHV